MCAGSIAAGIKERAEIGDALIVKTFQQGHFTRSPVNLKLFAPVNNPACPVCINFGSTVLFRDLPVNIQQRAGVYVETEAELVSPDVDFHSARDDVFRFPNNATVKLSELPDGTLLDVIPARVTLPAALPDWEIMEEPSLVATARRPRAMARSWFSARLLSIARRLSLPKTRSRRIPGWRLAF